MSRAEVVETAVIGGLCLLVLALLHKELVLLALDRTQAAAARAAGACCSTPCSTP